MAMVVWCLLCFERFGVRHATFTDPLISSCQHGRVLMYALHDYDAERDGDEVAWPQSAPRRGGGCGSPALARGSRSESRRLRPLEPAQR